MYGESRFSQCMAITGYYRFFTFIFTPRKMQYKTGQNQWTANESMNKWQNLMTRASTQHNFFFRLEKELGNDEIVFFSPSSFLYNIQRDDLTTSQKSIRLRANSLRFGRMKYTYILYGNFNRSTAVTPPHSSFLK